MSSLTRTVTKTETTINLLELAHNAPASFVKNVPSDEFWTVAITAACVNPLAFWFGANDGIDSNVAALAKTTSDRTKIVVIQLRVQLSIASNFTFHSNSA